MPIQDGQMPSLELEDIIHTMSPSPIPQQQDIGLGRLETASPEPLTEADIIRIRRRVTEMDLENKEQLNASSREKELVDMVLRLTESTLIEPTQLIHQAAIISALTIQRDFVVSQAEEERQRWESQKDSWARIAEALISQRNRPTNGAKDGDLERHCSAFEADNRALREKLHDTQSRLQSLESELTKLRPILLMQPLTTSQASLASITHASSVLSSMPYPSAQAATAKAKPKKKKAEPRVPVHSAATHDDQEVSDDQIETQPMEGIEQHVPPSAFLQFQTQPVPGSSSQIPIFSGDHYRKPTAPPVGGPLTAPPTTHQFQLNTPTPTSATSTKQIQPRTIRQSPSHLNSLTAHTMNTSSMAGSNPGTLRNNNGSRPKVKRSHGAPFTPLTSDARFEHLLLAARRIGRERAGFIAGFLRDRHSESEVQKQDRISREAERNDRDHEHSDRPMERSTGMSYYRRDIVDASNGSVGGSPQTPKREMGSGGVGASHYPNTLPVTSPQGVPTSAFVLAESSRGSNGWNFVGSPYPQQAVHPNTPRQQQTQSKHQHQVIAGSSAQQSSQGSGNPATPLASLLDAARMMNDETDSRAGAGDKRDMNGNSNRNGRRRAVSAIEQPESPVPKRRRVITAKAAAAAAANSNNNSTDNQREGVSRVRSALDVLADQAAAYSSHDQRGKGKARELNTDEGVPESNASKDKGKARAKPRSRAQLKDRVKEKEKEKPKPKPAPARKPRERVPRAPPRERTLAPAPTATTSRGKAGSAAPRMISPPGSRKLRNVGLSAESSAVGDNGMSPSVQETTSEKQFILQECDDEQIKEGAEGVDQVPRSGSGFIPAHIRGRPEESVFEESSLSQPSPRTAQEVEAEEDVNIDVEQEVKKEKDGEKHGEDDKKMMVDSPEEGTLAPPTGVDTLVSPAVEVAVISPSTERDRASDDEKDMSAGADVPAITSIEEITRPPDEGPNEPLNPNGESEYFEAEINESPSVNMSPKVEPLQSPETSLEIVANVSEVVLDRENQDVQVQRVDDNQSGDIIHTGILPVMPSDTEETPATRDIPDDDLDVDADAEAEDEDDEQYTEGEQEEGKHPGSEPEPEPAPKTRTSVSRTPVSSPSAFLPDNNPHPEPDPNEEDADADGDVDVDADGEADDDVDADGEVDIDAEGDVDLEIEGLTPNTSTPMKILLEIPQHSDTLDDNDQACLSNDNKSGDAPSTAATRGESPPPGTKNDDDHSLFLTLQRQDVLLNPIPLPYDHPDAGFNGFNYLLEAEESMVPVRKASYQELLAAATISTKRPRSPYTKWSQQEDDLLVKAVAKYGQKWDLVQKALPAEAIIRSNSDG